MANQQKVAEIYASLVLQTAELKAGLNEANSEIKRFTAQTRAEMNEAKGAMALLGDEIGVRLPRHLRGFVAELPGVASAMSAAFNAIAVIGLISIVVEAGKKVYEFVEKTEEAAKKHAEAWQSTIQPINDTNDKLELTKTKLDNAIAKMEHKPQNKIKEAIEEATVAADELGRHLDADIKKIADTLKGQEHNKISQLLLHQTGGIGAADIASDVQDKFNQISAGTFKGTGDQTKDRDAVIQKAIDEAFEKLRPAQIMADRITANFGGKAPATSSSVQDVKAYSELIAGLKGLQTQSALTQGINTDKLQLGKDTDAKDASDEHLKALEKQMKEEKAHHEVSISQEALFWSRHIADFAKGSDQYDSVIEKASQANQKVLENYWSAGKLASAKKQWSLQDEAAPKQLGNTDSQGEKQLEQAQLRSAESQAKINAQYTIAVDRINLATGAISAHTLAMDEAAAHALDYKQQLAALTAQLDELHKNDWMGDKANTAQEVGLQTQINSITNTAKIQEMQDAQNVLNTTWKGMIDSVFDEMIKKSQDTSSQVKAIAAQTIDGINSELAKGMTGQKMTFAHVFQNSAQSLAKTSLEKVEGFGLKALGLGGGKRDGSSSQQALFVEMAGGKVGGDIGIPKDVADLFGAKLPKVNGPAGAGTNSLISGASKGLLGMLNGSNFFSSLMGGKLFGSGSLFGGGFAAGGDVMGGVPIDVGELGKERFVPYTNGRIIPHNQMGSNGPTIGTIDARGTDPAMVNAAVYHGMRLAHAQAVHDSQQSMRERAMRTAH
jgi:hypothetical protein